MRRWVVLAVFLLTVAVAGCSGDRSSDNDNQKPVFYGGISGGPFAR